MQLTLMAVTLVSLALAIGMAVLAWKLLHEDRQRSAARSEALQAMAMAEDEEDEEAGLDARGRFTAIDDELETAPRPDPIFAAVPRQASGRRWPAVAALLVVAAAAGGAYAIRQSDLHLHLPFGHQAPLELISLRHTADSNGTFTVTGLVEDPAGGTALHHVIAVVYLFDANGDYFANGQAPLDLTALSPGEESPFVVHVPTTSRVTRYRVGFRSEAGGVVAHVNRRGQLPGGTTGEATKTSVSQPGAAAAAPRSES